MQATSPILNIGHGIKDLSSGAETEMKKAHDKSVEAAKKSFEALDAQYTQNRTAALRKKELAEAGIRTSRSDIIHVDTNIERLDTKKMLLITAVVFAILAAIAIGVAAVATGMFFACAGAAPLIAGAGIGIYWITNTGSKIEEFKHTKMDLQKQIEQFQKDLKAPDELHKPVLTLPQYDPAKDMELKETRLQVQESLSKKTLQELMHAASFDDMVKYALLDKLCVITDPQIFYGKINKFFTKYREKYCKYLKAHGEYLAQHWKAQQEFHKNEIALMNMWFAREQARLDEQYAPHNFPYPRTFGYPTIGGDPALRDADYAQRPMPTLQQYQVRVYNKDTMNPQFKEDLDKAKTKMEESFKKLEQKFEKLKQAAKQ